MNKYKKIGEWALLSALILQSAHMIEHLAQLYQFLVLRMPVFEAHGILFFLDLEQNHFYFNFIYLLMLIYGGVKSGIFNKNIWNIQWPRYAFIGGVAIQTYHVMEHTARIGQYIQTGCTPCKGLLGWYFNGIYLHFSINFITLVLPATAFFVYKIHKKIYHQE